MLKFKQAQFNKLADISSNIGLLMLGSAVIPALWKNFNLSELTVGVSLSLFFWIVSLALVKS